jgi:hypothetical protein
MPGFRHLVKKADRGKGVDFNFFQDAFAYSTMP